MRCEDRGLKAERRELKQKKEIYPEKKEMEAEISKDPSRRIDYSDYRIYIRRVLEEIDNTVQITTDTIDSINDLIVSLIQRILYVADVVISYSEKKTLSTDELIVAVKAVLPPAIANNSVSAGIQAERAVAESAPERATGELIGVSRRRGKTPVATPKSPEADGKTEGRKMRTLLTKQAGIIFSVSRIRGLIEEQMEKGYLNVKRISTGSPIFLAAAIEIVTAKILSAALGYTKGDKRVRIIHSDLVYGLYNDDIFFDIYGFGSWIIREINLLEVQ